MDLINKSVVEYKWLQNLTTKKLLLQNFVIIDGREDRTNWWANKNSPQDVNFRISTICLSLVTKYN